MDRNRKFEIAMERLSQEQDIQNLIQLNRITRLLHKSNFLTRQRKSFDYFDKYVITDRDVKIAYQTEKASKSAKSPDKKDIIELLLDGFDPEKSRIDRHILYEVTGLRMIDDEFRDDDSSEDLTPEDITTAV